MGRASSAALAKLGHEAKDKGECTDYIRNVTLPRHGIIHEVLQITLPRLGPANVIAHDDECDE
jgi:hypothetical protein